MQKHRNAETRSNRAQGAASDALLNAADLHVYRSPSAGPILLHIPTSRLFSISPALADHLTGADGGRKRRRGRDRAVATAAMARPRPSRPAASESDDISAALAELESLLRPSGPGATSPFDLAQDRAEDANTTTAAAVEAAIDPNCATSSEPLLLEKRRQGQGENPSADAASPDGSRRGPRWGDLTLFVTDRCNLRCDYCFESYGALREEGRTISRETAAAALDFFFDRLYPDAEVYDLHLFGGEPLLAWDMVEWITLEARRRAESKHVAQAPSPVSGGTGPSSRTQQAGRGGARPLHSGDEPNGHPALYMSISTNAIGLTAKQAAFLREHEFDVSVSFDGPPEVHDRYRKFANGRGSFAAMQKGLSHLNVAPRPSGVSLRQPPYTSVAGRLHRGNTDVFKSFLAAYEATGGKQGISMKPARLSREHPLSLRPQDIDEIIASECRLVDFLLERTAAGEYGYIQTLLLGNDPLAVFVTRAKTRSRGNRCCGAGLTLFAVATDGGVYPCRSLVGLDQYRLGDVMHGIERGRHEPWLHLTVEERDDCKACWARYLCGAGCYAHAAIACGGLAQPDQGKCSHTRGVLELAMELIARLGAEAPGKLDDALADVVFGLPEKHRIFVPRALQDQLGAPRIEAVEIEPRVVAPGGTVRGRVAVRARRPLAAVTLYDSGGGSRALTAETEPVQHWPHVTWFMGEDKLRSDAPVGRYSVGVTATDESGATARAFTSLDVTSPSEGVAALQLEAPLEPKVSS
jgi:uncharacterized protein